MGIPLYAHLLFKGYLCDRGAFSPSDSGERAASLCIFSTYVYPFDRQLEFLSRLEEPHFIIRSMEVRLKMW